MERTYAALQYTNKQVAQNLGVDRSTVSRTLQLFHNTGSVCKKLQCADKAFRKLTSPAQMLILTLVIEKPGIYLREIQVELLHLLLIDVEISTICRFLHTSGFTHQKLCLVALQRDEYLRQKIIVDVSEYKPEIFIFQALIEGMQYGYSMRGLPLKKHILLVRGERVSGIAIMSMSGILDVSISKGTTNGDVFYDFTKKFLLPQLQPFDGVPP